MPSVEMASKPAGTGSVSTVPTAMIVSFSTRITLSWIGA